MDISISYKAQAKLFAGKADETLTIEPDTTLNELVQKACQDKADNFRNLVFNEAEHRNPNLLIFINQQQIFPSENPQLNDQDQVLMMSPMSGG